MADITPVGDASGKSGNLPADVDEREVLDRLDDKDEKDDEKDKKEEKDEEDVEDLEDADEDDSKKDEEDEGEEDKKETDKSDEDDDNEEEDDELDTSEGSLYQKLKGIKVGDKPLLKAFPELRTTIFREEKFTELYPSLDAASEAKEMAETFVKFQEDIQSGNAKTFVEAVKALDDDTLVTFAGNFIPALVDLDKDAYLKVMYPEFKRLLRAAAKDPDENIRASARNLNYFLWQNTDINKDEGYVAEKKDPREEKEAKKRQEDSDKQFESFREDTISVALKKATKFISKSLDGLNLNDWTKNKLADDILRRTLKVLSEDKRYNGNMDALWKRARSKGLTIQEKESLINAFLSRAKFSIPKARLKVLTDAKVSVSKGTDNDNKDGKKPPTRLSGTDAPGGSGKTLGKINPRDIDWNATDERALLEGGRPILKKRQG